MKTKTDAEQAVEALDGSTYHHKLLSASIKVEEPAAPARPSFTRVQRPGATDRPRRRRI